MHNRKRLLVPTFDLLQHPRIEGQYTRQEFRVRVTPNHSADVFAVATALPFPEYARFDLRGPTMDEAVMTAASISFQQLAGEIEKHLRADFMAAFDRGARTVRLETP